MKKIIFFLFSILILLGVIMVFNSKKFTTININGKSYRVEIAKSQQDQIKGLSDRDNLENINGMIFIYDNAGVRSFWMKNMRFNIDIVWINDGKVIGFEENVSFADQDKHYISPQKCDMVLELEAGKVKEDNIKIGDELN